MALCDEPRRAVDVFPALFKTEIDDWSFFPATGESLAHIHYAVEQGLLEERMEDGVAWFVRS